MSKRWLGLSALSDSVIVIDAHIPDTDDPIVINADVTWRVQKGDRAAAYNFLHQQCTDYVRENRIELVVVKASAVSGMGGAKLGLLIGAEVRGVVMAAAAGICPVRSVSKAVVSRTYGNRNVDDYVADDAFWMENTQGEALRKLSREAAMLLIAARNA
jgi:hypothetical protein